MTYGSAFGLYLLRFSIRYNHSGCYFLQCTLLAHNNNHSIMNNYLLIILDSCRYDSVLNVWRSLKSIPQVGPLLEAYSFATWTHPAHLNFLTGRLPWVYSDTNNLRSGGKEYYSSLAAWETRLGIPLKFVIDEELDI